MAKNTQKRIPVKWIRDRAKRAYEKQDSCWICGTSQDLELHHLKSITLLLEKWSQAKAIQLTTDEEVLAIRDEFIEEHRTEIYDEVYTLCNRHHVQLHSVYGKSPSLQSADLQRHWIEQQRLRAQSPETYKKTPSYGSFFSKFT